MPHGQNSFLWSHQMQGKHGNEVQLLEQELEEAGSVDSRGQAGAMQQGPSSPGTALLQQDQGEVSLDSMEIKPIILKGNQP